MAAGTQGEEAGRRMNVAGMAEVGREGAFFLSVHRW